MTQVNRPNQNHSVNEIPQPLPLPFNPPSEIFREYDIRGRVNENLPSGVPEGELSVAFTYALGCAYGAAIKASGGQCVALGRDCRLSGLELMNAFERGVRSVGISVLQLGLVPTPLVYFALYQLPCDGGVVITGSHNPPQWNGFKMFPNRLDVPKDLLTFLENLF